MYTPINCILHGCVVTLQKTFSLRFKEQSDLTGIILPFYRYPVSGMTNLYFYIKVGINSNLDYI